MPKILIVDRASREFGGLRAVDGLSFEVCTGEIVGIIGPNGAGKTTLFNLLTGIYPLSSGKIVFDGLSLLGHAGHIVTHVGIARTFQKPQLFKDLTVEQHVLVGLKSGRPRLTLAGFWSDIRKSRHCASDQVQQALSVVGLKDDKLRLAADLPYGKRRLTEIERCLASEPRLLLLDEPSAGLNEAETESLAVVLEKLVSSLKLTLIVIDHDISFLRRLCPRLLAMSNGQLICDDSTAEVLENPIVVQSYLGDG